MPCLAARSPVAAGRRGHLARRPTLLPVGRAVPPRRWAPRADLYYFAFGSNVNTTTFVGRRGIEPLGSERCVLDGWRLEFSVPGMGPWEPAFATVAPAPGDCCHGMAFLVTEEQWAAVKRSEGVSPLAPLGYQVVDVTVRTYDGREIQAKTLEVPVRFQGLQPSARYLGLIREGALEWNLDGEWQAWLNSEVQAAPSPPADLFELVGALAAGGGGPTGAEGAHRTFSEWKRANKNSEKLLPRA